MGEMYRVHDTVLDVTVALKRVIGGTAADRVQVIREVRLARQITHRAVCRVSDVGESDGDFTDGARARRGSGHAAPPHRPAAAR